MKILVVLNGDVSLEHLKKLIEEHDKVIVADGAVAKLLGIDERPDFVVGDMDSADDEMLNKLEEEGVEIIRAARDSDLSDAEIAVRKALEIGAYEITMTGSSGGRVDHTFANFGLLMNPDVSVPINICEDSFEAFVVRDKEVFDSVPGRTVSLIPLALEVKDIWTEGFKRDFLGDSLHIGTSRGLSNEVVSPTVEVAIGAGALLVIHYREKLS